jgi:predicted HicB family RNase H-like nuclease
MTTLNIRGLDPKVLARLKRQAERDGSSLNALVLRLVQGDAVARAR